MSTMENKKMVKNWELLARGDDMEEVVKSLRVFANYWADEKEDELEMPDGIVLRGKIYGHEGAPDGATIKTSPVKTVRRVEREYNCGVPHDLMCATTKSGSEYHFYSDAYGAKMGLLLGTLVHTV